MSAPTEGHGLYEMINPDTGQSVWGPRLDQMAAGGFKLVINYNLLYGSLTNAIAYINYAATKGLKVIVALEHPWIWLYNNIAGAYPSIYASAGSPAYYTDDFSANSSASFTLSFNDGGGAGSWTWDTANKRLSVTGGAEPVAAYSAATLTDGYVEVTMDRAIGSPGLDVRRTDGNNCYSLYLQDATGANHYQIYRINNGNYGLLKQGSLPFTWNQGDIHRIRYQAVGTTISLYIDGVFVDSAIDSSQTSGKVGMSGGSGTTYFYSLSLSALPDFVTYVINQVKSLPGTWGWYIGDEIAENNPFYLHVDNIHLADATLPRLIIQTWEGPSNDFWKGTTPLYQVVRVGGDDYYPIGRGSYFGNPQPGTPAIASGVQAYCTAKGIDSAIVLQAFSWDGIIWPSVADMSQAKQDAEANMSPRMIFWYSYQDIASSSDPATYWNNLVVAVFGVAPTTTVVARGRDGHVVARGH